MPAILTTYWPVFTSILGVMFGGLVTWITAKSKLDALLQNHDALANRVIALEQAKEHDRVMLADRLARIETTLNAIHIKVETSPR